MKRVATLLMSSLALASAKEVDFAREVLPILSDACFHCHGPDEAHREAKLRLDTKEGVYRSLDGITVVNPGHPADSELVARITTKDEEDVMPPRKAVRQLKPEEIAILQRWVAEGAKWGSHWAFTPMSQTPPPAGATHPIDTFIRQRLTAAGVTESAPEARRERLLRRVTLDLTGVPPSLAEQDAFLADASPPAYEKVVDRLLASPRFGERLASEWLDVARYADTHGYQMDRFRPMWAYRDWVIRSFNQNLPYDQFVTWQLAGDLLPGSTQEQQLATAFNRLHCQNEEGGIVEEEYRVAYVVDRVNTFATAFLGLTTECSRCHDHKYDPITQRDFYRLFAFFQNIDEAGQTTYFTDSTPVPSVLLSTPAQEQELATLNQKIATAEAALKQARAEAAADFTAWVDKLPEGPSELQPDGEVARFPFDLQDQDRSPNTVPKGTPARAHEHPRAIPGHALPGREPGQAVELDGENGYTFPGVGHFHRAQPFTLGLWIWVPKAMERGVILHHSKAPADAGSRGYELLVEQGRLAFGLHHMWPGNSVKVRSEAPLPVEQWVHVTATYDGSSRAAGLHLYVNGQPAASEVLRDGLWKDITYGGGEPELTLGYRFRDAGFKGGRVDDLRLFARELTPIEVSAIAGREDFTVATQSVPELSPAQQTALLAYYAATSHQPSVDAALALQVARDAQRRFINPIPEAMAMRELPQPKKAYVLKRGAYDAPGEEVTADTPEILPPFPAGAPRNRLGLTQWLLDPEHPLMARVTVNRYWQMLFGRGLVDTVENFGTQGAQPTHPELLDWLARDFIRHRWDVKHLLKQMVMSATYRQETSVQSLPAAARQAASTADPDNHLLSYAPARRLTAEMLRDSALFSSGLLVEKLGGPSVKPYQPAGLWEEIAMGKPSYGQGKGDDLHRRSLYTFWKRTVPPPSMVTFDAADRSYCSVRRQSTSTPLQALALLNDVQNVEAARGAAARASREPNLESQLTTLFRTITSRPPTPKEIAVMSRLYTEQLDLFSAQPDEAARYLGVGDPKVKNETGGPTLAALAVVAQALQNHDEAIMMR